MKQLVFIDKDKDGKDRVFTTSKSGKMLFPHRNLNIDFEQITLLEDFEVVVEKENYGFFTGRKVELCLPDYKDLHDAVEEIIPVKEEYDGELYVAGHFYLLSNMVMNVLVTKEVESGEVLVFKESKYSSESRSLKNPHYYAVYNSISAIGKKYINTYEFYMHVFLSKENELSVNQKASIALHSHRINIFDYDKTFSYLYFDKCVVKITKADKYHKIYYIGPHNETTSVSIHHDILVDIIKWGYIHSYDPKEYKDAVDQCFEEGFADIEYYSCRTLKAEKEYERILGVRPFDEYIYDRIYDYKGYDLFALNIDKYDLIKSKLTDEQISALAKATKDSLSNIDATIKSLGKSPTKESIKRITELNYKRAITIAI